MKHVLALTAASLLSLVASISAREAAAADDWIVLFDGESLSGWQAAEHPESFSVRDGAIVCNGPRAHLFYRGEVADADFRNFELKATIKTAPGADSGLFFHTAFQRRGVPRKGYEIQIDNTFPGSGERDRFSKTGSLDGVRNQYKSLVADNEWFTVHVVVTGKRIRVLVNDVTVVDYTEPAEPVRDRRRQERLLSRGTFALQCHDPQGTVYFKDVMVRPLPDDLDAPPLPQSAVDPTYAEILNLHQGNFPLVDFHVHLKGGLTLEEALANSRKTGINYGIAPNCGLGFPITDDEGVAEFLAGMQGQPAFVGMQAEGREWVNLFSKEAIEKFDYVFTDAMTFTDDRGKRTRLWIKEEVQIDDKQAFMEMYVDRILSVLNNEPIDIYVNPTFLPECIAGEYDALWTEQRMQKVIDAAVRNGVAIEINARYRLPSPAFIKRAKQAGVKFSFGTNNGGRDLDRLEYGLEMIERCGLTPRDMFMPRQCELKE
ncbi:MAG: DUF1080 domain-containing protein [Pirellulales bacterium]|nr:DUF1080 domain-containing protein [Pirellulales bacterium]